MAAASAPALAKDGVAAATSRSWRDGPARYLLTDDEYRRFGRLRTPDARRAWAERFWRRLDPDPSTPANEFLERYEARLAETVRFREVLTPGWRTDRGRIFLLAGPPSAVRRDTRDATAVEREIWTYGADSAGARVSEIVFYRDREGRFRLEPERFVPGERDPEQVAALARVMRAVGYGSASVRLFVRTILESDARARWPQGAPIDPAPRHGPPPPPLAGPGAVTGLRGATWFFQADDGSLLTLFGLEAPEPPSGTPAAGAVWVWDAIAGPDAGTLYVPLAPTRDPHHEGRIVFLGRTFLEPGTYEVRYAVGEGGETLAVRGERVEAPELGTGFLSASSVVPAERFGPAPADGDGMFSIGSEEVVPRPGGTFFTTEPLRLYFQVYGAAEHPVTKRASVDLRVRFRRLTPRPRRHGVPFTIHGATGASIGLSLPTGDWPSGEYGVEIQLHDRVSGRRTTTEGRFRVDDPGRGL